MDTLKDLVHDIVYNLQLKIDRVGKETDNKTKVTDILLQCMSYMSVWWSNRESVYL